MPFKYSQSRSQFVAHRPPEKKRNWLEYNEWIKIRGDMSWEEVLIKIHAWTKELKQSKLICFNKFIKTLNKYKQQVVNYFIDRNSSGFVEGLNESQSTAPMLWHF